MIQYRFQTIRIPDGAVLQFNGTVDTAAEGKRFCPLTRPQIIEIAMLILARAVAKGVESRVGQHQFFATGDAFSGWGNG